MKLSHFFYVLHQINCVCYSLVLCKSGILLELCPYTNEIMEHNRSNDDFICDMIAISKKPSKIELMLLVKSAATQQMFIRIVGFPSEY